MSDAKFKTELTKKIYEAIMEFEGDTSVEVHFIKINRDVLTTPFGEILKKSVITGISYDLK